MKSAASLQSIFHGFNTEAGTICFELRIPIPKKEDNYRAPYFPIIFENVPLGPAHGLYM
jgi:hypothetical protein